MSWSNTFDALTAAVAERDRMRAGGRRLRSIVLMFHTPELCRYPDVECSVCSALAQWERCDRPRGDHRREIDPL